MGLSNSAVVALLDLICGSGSPPSYDIALSTSQPNDDGTNVTEPVGNGYAAAVMPNDGDHWGSSPTSKPWYPDELGVFSTNVCGPTMRRNIQMIRFPQPTGPWATAEMPIKWIALYASGPHDPSTFVMWMTTDWYGLGVLPDADRPAPVIIPGGLTIWSGDLSH